MTAEAHRFGVVLELLAVAPHALGGLVLRGMAGPLRERVSAKLFQLLGEERPCVRVPLHTTDDRLLGGLSLAASLQQGRPLFERGLLAAADGGMIVLPMAERTEPRRVAQLSEVLDRARISVERDGVSHDGPCKAGILALDEGLDDERLPDGLSDRLAFHIDLDAQPESGARSEMRMAQARSVSPLLIVAAQTESGARGAGATESEMRVAQVRSLSSVGTLGAQPPERGEAVASDAGANGCEMRLARERVARARLIWPLVSLDEAWIQSLCEGALALGIASLRAPLLAARVAQVHAALCGRMTAVEEDVLVAARSVLGPRATQLPDSAEGSDSEQAEPQQPDDDTAAPQVDSQQELIVAAAKSGIPRQLFESLGRAPALRLHSQAAGKVGAQHQAAGGGRPVGVRAAQPSAAERLHVLETLRAAAPWQRLRGREPGAGRVLLRQEDLRVRRYERRSETTVIFSVDASGSAALQRLAEAKGAVEQLLIDCYARRDQVALVAFRERAASLLLSPTRSLTRVRKSLAQLAGGGATPLASGIDAAAALAVRARKHGSLPIVVLMTDARANVARDGEHGTASAMRDALSAARELRAGLIASLFLDTSPRPREQAQRLAAELGARYLPLPYLNAASISAEVRALSTNVRSRA